MNVLLLISISAFLIILLISLYLKYRKELQAFLSQLSKQSTIIASAAGTIEYAERGEGSAVLFSHGGACGFDSGLMIGKWIGGFRIISPSRFGYLRTPLIDNVSPEKQADAYIALLDHLGIQKIAIIGISGGGPSSLYFALKYPERCWALCMLSAITQPLPQFKKSSQFILTMMSSSSFFYWLLTKMLIDILIRTSGITPEIKEQFYKDQEALFVAREIMRMFPAHLRRIGTLKDLEMCRNLGRIPVEHISCPTLIVHGDKDPLVPYTDAEFLAANMPHAELHTIKSGGHFCCVTHRVKVFSELNEFLSNHEPKEN